MKTTVKVTTGGKTREVNYSNIIGVRAGVAGKMYDAADLAGNGIPASAPLLVLIDSAGQENTFDARHVAVTFDDDSERAETLHRLKYQETLHAALSWAEVAERLNVKYSRLDVIDYCINSYQDISAHDAVQIADSVWSAVHVK